MNGGIAWVSKIHLKYPFKTLYVLLMTVVELFLFLIPISLTADVIQIMIEGGGLSAAKSKLFLLLGLAVIQAILYFSLSFVNEVLAHRVTTDMTQQLFESVQEKSVTYHDSKNIGDIMARATGDTRTVNIALSPGVRIIIDVVLVWGVNFFLLNRIHVWFALGSMVVFLIFMFVTFRYTKNIVPLSRKTRETFGEISEVTNTSFSSIRELKAFVSEVWATNRIKKQTKLFYRRELKEGTKSAWFYPQLIITIYAAGMIFVSLYFAITNQFGMNFKEVVLIAGTISLLLDQSEEMQWVTYFLVRGSAAAERVFAIINESDPGDFEDGTYEDEFAGQQATIEFQEVSFRYREDLPYVLNHISFKIEENQTIAIVGGPGSGKSTLTKLIQRLYLPTSGQILLGTRPITKYTNLSLRKMISTVEQDIMLLNTSVKENIRYGKPEASDEDVIRVAKFAEAHDFIMAMPNQYENLIGEGGVRLSGGQAQRLSIARALLVDPSILLIDDGASALDAQTEMKIQAAITEILETHTTVITTHRLAIISKADLIIILDKGVIVGMGSHERLIRSNIYYRRLFERHYELPTFEEATVNV
ncbi:MAG: ABC transporter ATP-binding protein [Promethearchaeota archaeon]